MGSAIVSAVSYENEVSVSINLIIIQTIRYFYFGKRNPSGNFPHDRYRRNLLTDIKKICIEIFTLSRRRAIKFGGFAATLRTCP